MLQIAKAREIRGWTQEQLAQAIGTTQQTVQRWESGQVDPKITSVEKISRAMGVTMSFLLGVEDSGNGYQLSSAESELLDIMKKITPDGQAQLMIFARGIASSYPKSNKLQGDKSA